MNEIIVRNSCIVIEGYHQGDSPDLEKNFMIWNPTTHQMDIMGMYFDKENERLYLPRGIDIWKIKKYLNLRVHRTETPNKYEVIENLKMRLRPRDEQQQETLKFMCGIGNDYEDNYRLPQLSINLATGKGKTYCSIASIAYYQMKSIIITASITLLKQWKGNIKEYTNLEEKDLLIISGSQALNMIYNNKSQRAKRASIYLISHSTIHSYCETYGWDKLNVIFKNLGIGIKYIDEAHQNFENMLKLDFFTNVFKTFYITATPERSDWRENRIYQLSLKNVPFIDLFDEENDPHTDYIAIKFNSRPNAYQVSAVRNMYGLDRNGYVNYLVGQPNFYKMMYLVMDLVLKCKGKVLMYIGTNEAILKVYKWIGENYPELLDNIGIYTSLIPKEDKYKEREKKLILSTTKSAGAGEDIKGLKMTIVIAEPFKSSVLAKQTLGRTRDKNTTYIEIVDLGFKQIRNFYNYKLPIYNKYALSTSDTMIDQYELDKRSQKLREKRDEVIAKSARIMHDERFFEYPEHYELNGRTYIIDDSKIIRPFVVVPFCIDENRV